MKPIKIVVSIGILLALAGCADNATFQQAALTSSVGFWYGLWHGIILPFAWLGSLFSDSIAIYAIYNNGGWYDFGFFMGVRGLSAIVLSR
jgi:hypothetical protein